MPDTTGMPQAWADLIEALTLMAKHQINDISPTHCEHDRLYVMADPAQFTPEELARLEELHFDPDSEDESTFSSSWYGSA